MGTYEAETEQEALNKLSQDAGYRDQADAEKQIPNVDRSDLIIEQVST